ncbi:hypothetical protein [Mesorhizobium retamae]|uniref:MarR family transcriptional regulator n=1 Tax=Mesorhizobium retamae TaxID=2912854 RepID=A0ABS9QLH8_9HYPH|nr:hypothetical protein [Mesorhizobium sp. IRAMC:0171]
MAFSADEIAGHPALHRVVRSQAKALLAAYQSSPRLSSVFATQQRWLMAHAGLALYFRQGALTTARFLQLVEQHSVASRNTADAFIKEMLQYNYVELLPGTDRRSNPLRPTDQTLQTLAAWAVVHLTTLDGLDGGRRLEAFASRPDALSRLEPLIADGLLTSSPIRSPEKTFSLFTWLNNGGVVMEWLISGVEPGLIEQDRIPTGVVSIGEFASLLKLSRTHLARKLREAEDLGSVGWLGQRGNSTMWLSRGFYHEYMGAQAVKLAIIDEAFEQGLTAA